MTEVIQGEGFTVKSDKFNFFFGRVTSSPDNQRRSVDNLNGLRQLGIEEENNGRERLLQVFQEGLNGTIIKVKRKSYGSAVLRKVEISGGQIAGAIAISYFYRNGDMNSIPEVTSLITKISAEEEI